MPNTDLLTENVPFVNNGVRNYTIGDFPQLFADLNLTVCKMRSEGRREGRGRRGEERGGEE